MIASIPEIDKFNNFGRIKRLQNLLLNCLKLFKVKISLPPPLNAEDTYEDNQSNVISWKLHPHTWAAC